MKKILFLFVACVFAIAANAVPARPVWSTVVQSDGTTIEVRTIGDEYYHYTINRDGQQVREVNGMYEVVGEAPTPEVAKARRAKSVARRQRKDVGTEPYPAPRGLLILANFSDVSFKSSNSKAVMDSLINAKNCQVNEGYGSAAQYFKDQSNGQYQPVFDVVGPVKLSKSQSYYGQNVGYGDDAEDKYATDAVIEACILANDQVNFADYDWNNDGYVDFVYVIYAGKGEADGGAESTIWPHNYSIQQVIQYATLYPGEVFCNYTKSQTKLDGKYLDNYAMSQELNGWDGSRAGNGTFCHEFGHVIGLPDFYDTSYGSNYSGKRTPNEFDIMDGGGYNGDGHCPPNYSAWEKYFMGWITPQNLGSNGAKLTLYPNGTAQHNVYQINASGKLQTATTEGLNYYIECRQQQGWDTYLPAAGMLIWQVNFNAQMWEANQPNLTDNGSPHYTLAIPSGTKIGDGYGAQNVWPYSSTKSWSGVSGKPLKDITKSGNNITLIYIEEPADPFDITWMANGAEFTTTKSTGKVDLPTNTPEACSGKEFVGWCSQANYTSATTAPTFVKAGDAVQEGATFYAVFATKDGEGGEAAFDGTTGGTYKIYAQVGDTKYYATSTVSNNKLQSTTSESTAAEYTFTAVSGGFTIKNGNKYLKYSGTSTNVSLSTTEYKWTISASTGGTWRVTSATVNDRALIFRASTYNVFGGYKTNNVDGTEYFDLKIGGDGPAYKDYTTKCESGSDIEQIEEQKTNCRKIIKDGQLFILRGDAVYDVTGARIQ